MSRNNFRDLKKEILGMADIEKAQRDLRFFKTGRGEYAEGDMFLGIAVPVSRKLARRYHDVDLEEVEELLQSPYNEERLIGLLVLIEKFEKAEGVSREEKGIYDFYVKHMGRVNNWNLVDLSASPIVGKYLRDKDREILRVWGKSENLWMRRIGIVATHFFIKERDYEDTLEMAELLLNDKEDLIHKAVGWMLREMGKMDESVLKEFLKKYQKTMPRTMLRYAIERLKEEDKESFMKGVF
ncbi:MAG: DNA alkylation repair protein [Verrucomicrobia bacterium]|nr:MAG: DNA alkylation repair protein [Verrucomicrobiota bacterium]